jgi:hypothetical protein
MEAVSKRERCRINAARSGSGRSFRSLVACPLPPECAECSVAGLERVDGVLRIWEQEVLEVVGNLVDGGVGASLFCELSVIK